MKKICTLLLTAGMLLGVAGGAFAIDFKVKGQWMYSFGLVDTNFNNSPGGTTPGVTTTDAFQAQQRVRLQIDAVASEALSGTVFFEIGDQSWGKNDDGAALGTDGLAVKVKNAYIDWYVPNTELSVRMGIQSIDTPSVAGGPAILSDDVAAVMANYTFNDNVSLTLGWLRFINDNLTQRELAGAINYQQGTKNYLDNMDAFYLSVPIRGENWSVNPWGMVGFYGDNALMDIDGTTESYFTINYGRAGLIPQTRSAQLIIGSYDEGPGSNFNVSEQPFTAFYFVGIPITLQMNHWNFELDFNYGAVESSGTYAVYLPANIKNYGTYPAHWEDGLRADMSRSGWLIKGLVEYKFDFGTAGLFAWYGSGDNDNVTDGSEMMPYIAPNGNFTSFLGDGELGWGIDRSYDLQLSYAGSWGIGLQLKDFSFMDNLSHTLRVAYWGGTNHPDNVRYIATPYGDETNYTYMVKGDYLVEVNFDTKYEMYENFDVHLQLGYIYNGINTDHWNNHRNPNFAVGNNDGYKATTTFVYSF